MAKLRYKRILLKLSGEAFALDHGFGISPDYVRFISKQIIEIHKLGIQIGLVTGGGNFGRGISASETGIERVSADYMGMLATVMNSIAIQNTLEQMGAHTRVMSALSMPTIAEPYIRRKAIRHLEKGRIVLFAAGTGIPYFSTDSAATLRAIETNCDIIMKGTKVDGVYDKDPVMNNDATKYDVMNFTEVINKEIAVMDTSSIALCRENNMPILVFNINTKGNLVKAAIGEEIGTLVKAKE